MTEADQTRVTALELFFDLVFVFTITQLTTVLVEHPTWEGAFHAVVMLALIWWMYDGYAWLTNAVGPSSSTRRLLLLGGMAGFLLLALAIPGAFTGSGTAFGLAYVAVVLIHTGLFSRASGAGVRAALIGLTPYNLVTAAMVLVGGVAGGTAQVVLWAAAAAVEWVTPQLIHLGGFEIGVAHFVERHGLVVIVALGESIVAIGIGAAGLPIDLSLVAVAVLGLALSASLWWAYFGNDDDREAERALAAAPPPERPRMAVNAFGYGHMPILLGIVMLAAGVKKAVGHPFDDLAGAPALFLAAGVALFLLGDVALRRELGIGIARYRTAALVAAAATVPLGLAASAAAQLLALTLIMAVALTLEASARASAQAASSAQRS